MPVLICQKPNSNLGSPVITDKGIQRDDTSASAVFLSLGLDLRVDGEGGWWQETYSDMPQGSKLWSLAGRKITTEVLALAVQYAEEALQWMIDDGIASEVGATAVDKDGRIDLLPTITLIDGTKWEGFFRGL